MPKMEASENRSTVASPNGNDGAEARSDLSGKDAVINLGIQSQPKKRADDESNIRKDSSPVSIGVKDNSFHRPPKGTARQQTGPLQRAVVAVLPVRRSGKVLTIPRSPNGPKRIYSSRRKSIKRFLRRPSAYLKRTHVQRQRATHASCAYHVTGFAGGTDDRPGEKGVCSKLVAEKIARAALVGQEIYEWCIHGTQMVGFFELPRELRDLVYAEVILWECPLPTLGEAQWLFRFRRISSPQSCVTGEYGCAYSHASTPRTCANFLCCNRQVYAEMREAIARVERRGALNAKLDCIAEDESFHYFTWLAAPLVKTTYGLGNGKEGLVAGWVDRWVRGRWGRLAGEHAVAWRTSSTRLSRLWIDVRLVGDRSAKWLRNTASPDRTSWAICAALKRLLQSGPDLSSQNAHNTAKTSALAATSTITIEELIINVIPPPGIPPSLYLDEDFPANATGAGVVHPRSVARELVDVWNKIWKGDTYKATLYQVLLERIERVGVCVDGEVWRVRELRLELERGRAEAKRLAARGR
ncbi:hypothetical protein K458DRAFT_431509 [Lentithecium fluviatile CBS 122367]|uniref:Uncharacterized protein n=1 Tax=Lentithecium fluviatile CBS 122367 TaxID=1168545 RepID=A0A6G1J256_9PLEO|nr:hypothetical protein K458DRAFT_431509 [Lentithecium fluviatile CBS 122367]